MTTPSEHADALDETVVRVLYQRLLDRWNARDADGYAELFATDGRVIGFDGSPANGRCEIAEHLASIFSGHQTGAYVGIIREVIRLSDDVEMLHAAAGMVPHGASDIQPAVNAIQTVIAARREGEWKLALFQNTPAAFHGRPEAVLALTEELREAFKNRRSSEA